MFVYIYLNVFLCQWEGIFGNGFEFCEKKIATCHHHLCYIECLAKRMADRVRRKVVAAAHMPAALRVINFANLIYANDR